MEGDIRQLNVEIERLRNKLNVGVLRVLEEGDQEAAEPLSLRLTGFLTQTEIRLHSVQKQMTDLDIILKATMRL